MRITAHALRAALAAAVALAALSARAPAQEKAPAKGPAAAAAKAPLKPGEVPGVNPHALTVKSFELAHADPEEVRQTLTQMWVHVMAAHGARPGPPGPAQPPRLAVDARTRTLFVRGNEKELEAVSELVAVLDGDPAKPGEGKNARVVRLHHAKVGEVLQVLTGLGLAGQVLALPKSNTLILPHNEAEAREVRAVVEKLDVEPRTDNKAGKKTVSSRG
jgi:type II secretory pathway component GspD/PulD (secretin)